MSFIAPRFAPPERILMGPGPSEVPKRILSALAAPTIGHLDPEYLKIMDEVRDFLRQVFRTKNELTMAVSGTGSAGMEACVVNLLEPGDEAGVCVKTRDWLAGFIVLVPQKNGHFDRSGGGQVGGAEWRNLSLFFAILGGDKRSCVRLRPASAHRD